MEYEAFVAASNFVPDDLVALIDFFEVKTIGFIHVSYANDLCHDSLFLFIAV